LGSDYIELAFRIARAADPNVKLYYNDYVHTNDLKAEVIRKMILDINDRYKRETGGSRNLIEGVGLQSHFNEFTVNIRNERSILDKYASLGIEIAITELDVASTRFLQSYRLDTVMSERDQITQGRLYAQLFQLYKEYSNHISHVIIWGTNDHISWRSDGNPTLFDRNFNAKQAFHAVSDPEGFLRRHRR
jgi:endo-1,4-beta-xylanase